MQAEVESHARRPSPLHFWDARWKVATLGVAMAVLASLHTLPAAGLGTAAALALLSAARLPLRLAARNLASAQVFLLPCLLVLPFTFSGDPFLVGGLSVSAEGLRLAALFYLRAFALVAMAMALAYSTPMMSLLRALQDLRLPRVLLGVTLLTYRYLSTLADEFHRMRGALATRGFRPGCGPKAWRPLANLVGAALVRSLGRADRIARATRTRGFTGHLPDWPAPVRQKSRWLPSAACATVTLAVWLVDRACSA